MTIFSESSPATSSLKQTFTDIGTDLVDLGKDLVSRSKNNDKQFQATIMARREAKNALKSKSKSKSSLDIAPLQIPITQETKKASKSKSIVSIPNIASFQFLTSTDGIRSIRSAEDGAVSIEL